MSMSTRIAIVLATVLLAAGGYFVATKAPADSRLASAGMRPIWSESTWPFPIDEWGKGWAYKCNSADCGVDLNLYLRPKIGFCNCQTGVADDAELERVSDLDLFNGNPSALGPGQPITVQWMKGRSRDYRIEGASAKSVLSLAFNNRCDVIVATVAPGHAGAAQEEAVLAFLNGDLMRHWAEQVLGL
jgi:hypothetical protein